MVKPTPIEVANYAYSIGFILDGDYFCDYYESKGWVIGKSPMKNWQAAVRTWKRNTTDPRSFVIQQRTEQTDKLEAKKTELKLLRERLSDKHFENKC